MSTPNNPYEVFLGIQVEPGEVNYYRLFGLDARSVSAQEISIAADRVIAKVRAQKPGDLAREWAALIDELGKAKKKLISSHQLKSSAGQPGQLSPTGGTVSSYAPPAASKASPSAKPAAEAKAGKTKTGSVSPKQKGRPAPGKAGNSPKAKPSPSQPPQSASPSPNQPLGKKAKSAKGDKKEATREAVSLPPRQSGSSKKNGSVPLKSLQQPVTGAASGPADDMSFTLAAPEKQDSFDSDTNLSASNFQPTSVMALTVDPMAPVPDPTGNWDGFDLSTLNENGALEGAVATVAQSANLASAPVGSPEMGISEKTFYSQSYRAKSKVGLMVGGTLLAMLIVGGISYAVIFGFQKGSSGEVADAGNGDKEKKEGEGVKDSGGDANSTASDGSKTGDNRQAEPDPEQGDGEKGSGDEDTKSMKKNPTDGEPDGDPGPGTGTPEPEKKGDPPKKKDDEPAEEMKKEEPKDLPPPKNSEIAELARLLSDARQKLVERNMVETTRLLDKAGNMPILPDHKLKLDRLKEVAELYGKFWNKVVEGCGKLKGLDEIKFSDTNVVGVVESSEEKIVYKALGKRFEKAPRELQIGLAMKIAEKEMNVEDVEFRMVKGAVFAIDAINNPDRAEQAKILWEEAKLLGGETDELILFLDDTYDLLAGVIKKEKVPEEDAATAAQEKFKATYEAQLKTASRNQKAASELASQLLADVPTMDQPADRHANFVAAIFYASKFGDVELTMKAISDMNKWFSIDMEKETLDALTKMNRNRLKPDQKREITRTAFEFMDRAKADSNKELELKFAELALLSARGTRDPKLIQTAENEVRRLKAAASMPDSNQ